MAQTYSDKPTLEAWNALGTLEIIETITLTEYNISQILFDVSALDWSKYQFVGIWFRPVGGSGTYPYSIQIRGWDEEYIPVNGATNVYGLFAISMAGCLAAFLPMHSAEEKIRCLYLAGSQNGMSYADDAFSSIAAIRISGSGMNPNTSATLWAMR